MRHKKHTFKIGRTGAHRRAMMSNLLSGLFTHGRIKTTVTKAKELRRWADKMVTCAKVGDLHNRRKAISTIRDIDAVRILFDEVAPRFGNRNGGYTRIVRIGSRQGDGAELCFIELVEELVEAPKAKAAPAAPAEEAPAAEEAAAEEVTEEAPAAEEASEEAPAAEEAEEKKED